MAYPALKKFNYLGQFGVLAGLTGAGLIVGSIISLIPLLSNMNLSELSGAGSKEIMEKIMVPENAGKLRLMQFISTLFIFFIPAYFYAKICHQQPLTHLGYKHSVSASQAGVVLAIMLVSLPLVSALGQLTEMMPFSQATFDKFRRAEEEYMRQVEVIGRMNNFWDFVVSLFMLAILPAVFEETLFRGGLQNLLSRWLKTPVLAIVITSVIFSIVHFSYIGFMSRVVLGFLLGWMYYRTGNLRLSILAHMVNNSVALIALYVMKMNDPELNPVDADTDVPVWTGLISLPLIIWLVKIFDNVSKHQVDRPGEEVLIEQPSDHPFGS